MTTTPKPLELATEWVAALQADPNLSFQVEQIVARRYSQPADDFRALLWLCIGTAAVAGARIAIKETTTP